VTGVGIGEVVAEARKVGAADVAIRRHVIEYPKRCVKSRLERHW
jgi:hypothetical protein